MDSDGDDDDEEDPSLDSEEIESLEKGLVTQEIQDKIPKCLICLEAFHKEEEVTSLLCDHFYHQKLAEDTSHLSCVQKKSQRGNLMINT